MSTRASSYLTLVSYKKSSSSRFLYTPQLLATTCISFLLLQALRRLSLACNRGVLYAECQNQIPIHSIVLLPTLGGLTPLANPPLSRPLPAGVKAFEPGLLARANRGILHNQIPIYIIVPAPTPHPFPVSPPCLQASRRLSLACWQGPTGVTGSSCI